MGDGEEAWHVVNGFGRNKEKEMAFFQDYKKSNWQIMDIYPLNLQTKFQEDPMVNEGWAAFLPRQLHVASLVSFIKRLPREASLWLL